jgi:twitching motility protein PilU
MPSLTDEQARTYITKLLTAMSRAGGSDLFVSKDFPPAMKMQGAMQPLTNQKLSGEVTRELANSLMNERQRVDFARDLECNFAISYVHDPTADPTRSVRHPKRTMTLTV